MSLKEYNRKRDFAKTHEPSGKGKPARHKAPIFVVQEHHASTHHFDFRLEQDGVLKSWAVPKGPSMVPGEKRLAVEVEDHPLSYATFSGDIPAGSYGAGHVEVWDNGTYERTSGAIEAGKLDVDLHGKKLTGEFTLVRTRFGGKKNNWLLIKKGHVAAPLGKTKAERPTKSSPERVAKVAPRKKVRRAKEIIVRSGKPEQVRVTHPEKVMYPGPGYTKQDVVDFYEAMADVILPYLKGRPVTVERFPEGVGEGKARFWQKNVPAYYASWVPRVELASEDGSPVTYAVVDDRATLLYLVNQNAVTFHIYLSRVGSLDRPDFVLFDLDPGEAAFKDVVAVTKTLHEMLDAEGVANYLKTSGKTGLHVLATPPPKSKGYDAGRAWAESVADRLVKEHADIATVAREKAKRGGRMYVDVVQNALGHHLVAPYSLRATDLATVSTPLDWKELTSKLDPRKFTLRTLPKRVKSKGDLMEGLIRQAGRRK